MGLASYHDLYLIARQGGNLASLENCSIHFVHQGLELLSSYWQACCFLSSYWQVTTAGNWSHPTRFLQRQVDQQPGYPAVVFCQ